MFACIWYGMPPDGRYDPDKLKTLDWPALVYGWLGFGLLYAGIDQGNRLDWTRSGFAGCLGWARAFRAAAHGWRPPRTTNHPLWPVPAKHCEIR
jgi:hypothetical protein